MGYQSIEDLDVAIEWDAISTRRRMDIGKGSSWNTGVGIATIHEVDLGGCGHVTCYETHDTRMVFFLGGRYFLKRGTYDSQDGLQWEEPLQEVRPVEKTVTDFEEVPPVVWNLAQINTFLNGWMRQQEVARHSDYDWTTLWYAAHKTPVEPEGFPWPIRATEQYMPGQEDCNGPVWLIFEINGVQYAAKGRNVSHVGWDFDGCYGLEIVEKKTVTMEVWQ